MTQTLASQRQDRLSFAALRPAGKAVREESGRSVREEKEAG